MNLIINYKVPIYNTTGINKFEIKYIYEIEINTDYSNKIKKGGDIFDDINIDDIIIKKEDTKVINDSNNQNLDKNKIKEKNNNYGIISQNLIKKHNIKIIKNTSSDIIHYKIKNINFSIYNSIYDIKLLIYYLLEIPIENQNLFNKKNTNLFYEYYNVITNEQINVDIDDITNLINIKYYNNIPIDFDLITNRINYIIESYEKNKYIEDINAVKENLEIDLVCLDDFINKIGKENLYNEIKKDDELLIILYKGFIEKYFPYYTNNLLLLYLNNEDKRLEFPELNIPKDKINIKNNNFVEIYLKDKKYKDNLININYKKLIFCIPSYNASKIINLKEFFNNLELKKNENVKKIELQLEIDNKLIYFSKHSIFTVGNKLNELNLPFVNTTYNNSNSLYINNKFYNSLLGSIYLKKNILFIVYTVNENDIIFDIYIIIDELFEIYIIYNISDYLASITKNNSIEKYKEQVINYINKLFQSFYNNKIIKNKIIINNNKLYLLLLDSQIIINQNINISNFNKIYSEFLNLEILDYYKLNNYDETNNIIELVNYKIKYEFNNENKQILNELSNNYYNFYIKTDLIEKYKRLLYFSKIIINNRIKDIKIDIINIKNEEINDILKLLYYILFKSMSINNKNDNNDKLQIKNKLKKLKEVDPVLYAINKKNTQNLYSRKCQASQQPDILELKDLKKIKNYIKYINFTTGDPIYYTCNNKKFPTVKFLTNLHPQNYCIPCCKKKAIEDVKVKSKYTAIHNECLTSYKYDKKNLLIDEKSRYIMNYSPKIIIEHLRLMQIPNELIKLFNKTYETSSILDDSTSIDNKKELKYYIYGINQDIGNIAYIGIFNIISFVLNIKTEETINIIKKIFKDDINIFNNILNGKLLYEFKNVKNFLIIFTNIFQDKILLSELDFSFDKWNELFIEILKYFGYIIIIFEEIIQEPNDYDIQLNIPENIKYVNEYIYNNENYKYILLIKRKYQNKNLYYPIIKTDYLEYYSKNIITNKIYLYNSQIIHLITEIIKSKLQTINNSLNLEFIEKFVLENKNYTIDTYFINNKNEIYSILLKYLNKHYIYININKQKVLNNLYYLNSTQNKKFKNGYINLKSYDINLNNILIFIKDINNYIYNFNKQHYNELTFKHYINMIDKNLENLYKIDINEFIAEKINNIYSYIYIAKFIIYNDKIIGIIINTNINNSNYYYNLYITKNLEQTIGKNILNSKFNEIKSILNLKSINKENIKKIITRQFLNNKYQIADYLYNPNEINKIIYDNKYIEDNRIKNLNDALYHTNLYNLLLIHFSNKLYKIKNTLLRSKIKNVINNLTKNDIELILSNKFNKISELLQKNIAKGTDNELKLQINYNTTNFIKNQIYKYIKNEKQFSIQTNKLQDLKKNIINNLDNTLFLFDKLAIYNIIELNKKDAIKELDKIFKDEIIHSNVNKNENITLELCENIKSSYNCKNNKLIISKELYYKFLDIWYYDLTNPFKQKLILNLVNYNLNNIYQFKQFYNEKIYIYL